MASKWKDISEFNESDGVEVVLWSEEYDHPSTGKMWEGKWLLTANGADTLFYEGTFQNWFVEAPTPTHFRPMYEPPKKRTTHE